MRPETITATLQIQNGDEFLTAISNLPLEDFIQIAEKNDSRFNHLSHTNNLWEAYYNKANYHQEHYRNKDWKKALIGEYYFKQAVNLIKLDQSDQFGQFAYQDQIDNFLRKSVQYDHFLAIELTAIRFRESIYSNIANRITDFENNSDIITDVIELYKNMATHYGSIGYFRIGMFYSSLAKMISDEIIQEKFWIKAHEYFRKAQNYLDISLVFPPKPTGKLIEIDKEYILAVADDAKRYASLDKDTYQQLIQQQISTASNVLISRNYPSDPMLYETFGFKSVLLSKKEINAMLEGITSSTSLTSALPSSNLSNTQFHYASYFKPNEKTIQLNYQL